MLLFQALQFLRDKILHLLDIHSSTSLQVERWRQFQCQATWGVAFLPPLLHAPITHIILCLQVPCFLAQEAEDAGEMLIADPIEHLWRTGTPWAASQTAPAES